MREKRKRKREREIQRGGETVITYLGHEIGSISSSDLPGNLALNDRQVPEHTVSGRQCDWSQVVLDPEVRSTHRSVQYWVSSPSTRRNDPKDPLCHGDGTNVNQWSDGDG